VLNILLEDVLHNAVNFDELMTDSHRLKLVFLVLAISLLLYNLVYIFLTAGGGAPSSFKPWLAIHRS